MEMQTSGFLLLSIAAVLLAPTTGHDDSKECVYTLYVLTGPVINAGTDSTISVTLADYDGKSVHVSDLENWGVMGRDYDYFERGSLDIFTGRGPCIGAPICFLNLTSDASRSHHGWFCSSIEVTSTGVHKSCRKSFFDVDQWLGLDVPPFQRTVTIDGCGMDQGTLERAGYRSGPFVVTNTPPIKRPIRFNSA